MVPKGEHFEMRLEEDTLTRVDRWRAEQSDVPSRAEAMRRLIEVGLDKTSTESVKFTDGEKLLLIMMRDLFKHLNVTDADVDPEFVGQIIWGGHYWAAKWALPGIFHDDEDDPKDLRYVQNVLDMWDRLERGYDRLSKKEKATVEKEAAPFGKSVKFMGFDGNNETSLMGIARFLVNEMKRWSRFEGRELNAHMPTRALHDRMLRAFEPMRRSFEGELSTAQIVTLLKAMPHPD